MIALPIIGRVIQVRNTRKRATIPVAIMTAAVVVASGTGLAAAAARSAGTEIGTPVIEAASVSSSASGWVPVEPFNSNIGTGAFMMVHSVIELHDGDLIVGGVFPTWDGIDGAGSMIRLNPDGTSDTESGFNTGTRSSGWLSTAADSRDGRILVGSNGSGFNGQHVPRLFRVDHRGVLDTTFNQNIGRGPEAAFAGHEAGRVETITVLESAVSVDSGTPHPMVGFPMVVGGDFTAFAGTPVGGIVKLNPNGTIDTRFTANLGAGANDPVISVVAVDSGFIVMGDFTRFDTTDVGGVVKLNPDGTIDAGFTANLGAGANASVLSATELAGGDILLTGRFTSFNGYPAGGVVRLTSSGARETATGFNSVPAGAGGNGFHIAAGKEMPDGDLILGGEFTTFNGTSIRRIVRVNADGSIDTTDGFNDTAGMGTTHGGTNGMVLSVDRLRNGDLMLSGLFSEFNGRPAGRIVRLSPVDLSIAPISDQRTVQGTEVEPMSAVVTVSDSAPISYEATGLPAGIHIDRDTGAISGTPTVAGTFDVVVTATRVDATHTPLVVGTAFTWEVTAAPAVPDPTYDIVVSPSRAA